MSEIPRGYDEDPDTFNKWRSVFIAISREWANGNISAFLSNRLAFQRGFVGKEIDNVFPCNNRECLIFDALLLLRSEEGMFWTEEENRKITKIVGGYISVCYQEIVDIKLTKDELDPISSMFDNFFEGKPGLKLDYDERIALNTVLHHAGRRIDPKQKYFPKPQLFTSSH